jgi:hypothetical protein
MLDGRAGDLGCARQPPDSACRQGGLAA